MYCQKCGTKADEDTVFCQKCGTKMISENDTPQSTDESVLTPEQLSQAWKESDTTTQESQQAQSNNTEIPNSSVRGLHILNFFEKFGLLMGKSKKLSFLVFALIAVIVIVRMCSGGGKDYIGTVQQLTPFREEGYRQTYQQVLSHFIDGLKWTSNEVGDEVDVIAQGTIPDYGNVEIVISITPAPSEHDLYYFEPFSVTIGNERNVGFLATAVLRVMFYAYDQGYSSWNEYQNR